MQEKGLQFGRPFASLIDGGADRAYNEDKSHGKEEWNMPCTTVLVGKKASNDNSTMIARTDDGRFDVKKLIVVEPKDQKRTYTSVGGHLTVELPENPMRYTACPNVDPTIEGIWAATGINAANVGMTATETITSNPRVLSADPLVTYQKAKTKREKDVPGGIGEEDIVVLVLPYIRTAREGVLRLGELLERYGTYESNGIAFNDENEIWWMETIGGHHWMAKRVPDDVVVVMPNQFGMDSFDFDDAFGAQKAHLCSKDLKEFIETHHLDCNRNGTFNPRLVFGSHSDQDHVYNTPRAWYMGRYLAPRQYRWDGPNADFTPESDDIPWSFVPDRKIAVEEVKELLSSNYKGSASTAPALPPYVRSAPTRRNAAKVSSGSASAPRPSTRCCRSTRTCRRCRNTFPTSHPTPRRRTSIGAAG